MKLLWIVSLFFVVSCSYDVCLYTDEIYYQTKIEKTGMFETLKQECKAVRKSAKMTVVSLMNDVPDITPSIEKNNASIILLSPFLAKNIGQYCSLFPDKTFVELDSVNFSTGNNRISIFKDREEVYTQLGIEIGELEKSGVLTASIFYIGNSMRLKEKDFFSKSLDQTTGGIHRHIMVTYTELGANRNVDEQLNNFSLSEVSLILSSGSMLNFDVIKAVNQKYKFDLITENVYIKDEYFFKNVCWSIVYDYGTAFRTMLSLKGSPASADIPLKGILLKFKEPGIKIKPVPADNPTGEQPQSSGSLVVPKNE